MILEKKLTMAFNSKKLPASTAHSEYLSARLSIQLHFSKNNLM